MCVCVDIYIYIYIYIYVYIYIICVCLTWGHCALQSNSMKAPQFTAEFRKDKENFIKHIAGYTTVNQTSMAELESMVASKYHAQKLKTRSRLINDAQPIEGGKGQKREGKATG